MNYIVQISFFIIACLGAYYTWRKDRKGVKRGQRNRLSILFGIAVVGAALALFYAVKNEKEEQENIALIQKINALQNEVLNQFTGNGSYCKLLLVNINVNNDDKALVFFSLEGKYPLRNVEARIIELNTLTQKNFADHKDIYINIGPLEPTTSKQYHEMSEYKLDKVKGVNLNIVFSSNNGFTYQYIRMRYVNNTWTKAERIEGEKIGRYIEEIDKDYPVQDPKLIFQSTLEK